MQRKYTSTFVPARPSRPAWLLALLAFFAPRPRSSSTTADEPSQKVNIGQQATIYIETPAHVWHARDRAAEARRLLRRYIEGRPVSRRECMRSGMSDGAWRRARRTLQRAEVISPYDGRLLYARRDAQLRLDVYLDQVEFKCWQSGRFVAP